MNGVAVMALTLCLTGLMQGCTGFADHSNAPTAIAPRPTEPRPAVAVAVQVPVEVAPPRQVAVAKPEAKPSEAERIPMEVAPDAVQIEADLQLARTARFDGYLTDELGQPLYMLVDDIIGSATTACLGECARDWPPFDVAVASASPELNLEEVSRFHRQDGAWQTTYKGHPLYYRAAEAGTAEVTSDGLDQRWFVARDYLAFLSRARTFAPEGGTATDSAFLTDGFGRTLYVCLDDTPAMDPRPAVSECDTACTVKRPVFASAETGRTTLLPSVIDPEELRELVRPDGQLQLTYRGWPLYYFSGDTAAGSTASHNDRAWRAIDPVAFAIEPERTSEN